MTARGNERREIFRGDRFKIEQIVAVVNKVKGEEWEMYRDRRADWGRAMVLMVARRKAGIANRTLADWLGGKHDSSVTQAVKRLEARMTENPKLMKLYRRVEKKCQISRCDPNECQLH